MSEQLDSADEATPASTYQRFLTNPDAIALHTALDALFSQLPKKRQRKALKQLMERGNTLEREGVIYRLRPPVTEDRRGLMLATGRAMLAIARRWELPL